MELLDGKKLSQQIKEEIKLAVKARKDNGLKIPHLAAVLVGNDGASLTYVGSKVRSCEQVGFKSTLIRLEDSISEEALLSKIKDLNSDITIDGFIVQLPLPKHIDEEKILLSVDPNKDVDGFHPNNIGNLSSGYESSIPCTPLGCYLLIKKIEPNLNGKKAVIIGRSNLNGKPMTQLLLKENCTVTITHSKTKDLKAECLEADIIVAAVGIPELVKGDWVKKDTIVIDVGINKTDKGIVGDVAFEEVSKNAKALTPVPGGVGPMTIACLLKNTIDCFKRSQA